MEFKMRKFELAVALATLTAFASPPSAKAEDQAADCATISLPDVRLGMTTNEFRRLCEKMSQTLSGVTADDVRDLGVAVAVFRHKGYKNGQQDEIAADLIDILRLRGLAHHHERWHDTSDLVWKIYSVEGDFVSPETVREFLKTIGLQQAKNITDDQMLTMLAALAVRYKNGD
jgi:hypothetical protein